MTIRKLTAAAALGAAALGNAHAITIVEDFNSGNSFNGGTRVEAGADDFLLLSAFKPSASRTYWFESALAELTISFWYSGPFGNNGSVSLGSFSSTLGNTPGSPADYLLNNPGPQQVGIGATYDKYFETATLYNLAQGEHTLTFSNAANPFSTLKIDDVTLTALPVPEPETYTLMLAGLGVVGWLARRRRPNRG